MKREREIHSATKAGARITEHRLDNGMTVLLAERHHDPVVAVMMWYRVGSRDEEEREAGVSHFLEHMMFKGSRGFGKGEIDRVTTSLGGSNNAFTSPDHTAYWFEFASDRWERALEIEADRMRHLLLDPREFEAEKSVVLEELSMGEDDPWRALTREVSLALFRVHPYRRPIIGFADTLRRLSVTDMRDYYARSYHPGNAVLVLCGDFDARKALALVRERFGRIAAPRKTRAPGALRSVEEPRGPQRLEIRWDDEGRRLCMAWPTVSVGADDDWTLDVVSTLLAGSKLSRLHRRLVIDERLATSVSAHNDTRVDTGIFWVYAEAAQGVEPGRLERAIDEEIQKLAIRGAPAKELVRAKRTIAADEAHESETVSDIAEDLGEYAADTRWQFALETASRIARVGAADVRKCVARFLRPERRVLGWCLPKKDARPAARKPGRARRSPRSSR